MNTVRQPHSTERLLTRAWATRGWLACLLWPLSLVFGALGAIRRRLYQLGFYKVEQVPALVMVVGNVIAGGSGKTPVVMTLVKHLQARGIQVGVISRGYGRASKACLEVQLNSPVSEVGDEPALIHRNTLAPVFVAARRIEAARQLLLKHPATQVIICDDGLQHLELHRDVEICVFDDRGVGNGWQIPAGPLREPWPRAADFVLHTGQHPAFEGYGGQRTLARCAIRADETQLALEQLIHQPTRPLLAVAAIAKPEAFFGMLRELGLKLDDTLALPDHYDFSSWHSNDYEAYTVICTEKDAVKLWRHHPEALAVPLVFTPEPRLLTELDALIDRLLPKFANPRLSSSHGYTTT
jgi:tetraacyldisaccharide 4'-kinase